MDTSSTDARPMDYLSSKSKIRITDLIEAKQRKERWVMLTSYDTVSARIFDLAKIPCILVGDSAAQAVLGYKSTIPITVDELIPLTRAVSSSCQRALVVADLPFGSYQESPELALKTATRFMKEANAHAVKLEGGAIYSRHVKLLTESGIPVMGHIGFTPQSEHFLGGFKVQARDESAIQTLVREAKALEDAGAFSCVLEMVPPEAGLAVTKSIRIPTIGVGAGPHCDAHGMVWTDMAGFTAPVGSTGPAAGYLMDQKQSGEEAKVQSGLKLNRVPKFVKRYANMSEILYKAALDFAADVQTGGYPSSDHCYQINN